jgi:hypothetical protein
MIFGLIGIVECLIDVLEPMEREDHDQKRQRQEAHGQQPSAVVATRDDAVINVAHGHGLAHLSISPFEGCSDKPTIGYSERICQECHDAGAKFSLGFVFGTHSGLQNPRDDI